MAQRFRVRGREVRTGESVEFEAFEALSLDAAVNKLNSAGIAVDEIGLASDPVPPPAPPPAPVRARPRGRVLTVRITPATQWRLTSAVAVGIIGGLTGFVLLWFFALSVLIGISQAARETPAFPGEGSSWAAPPIPEPEWRRRPVELTTGEKIAFGVVTLIAAAAGGHYVWWRRRQRRGR